MGTIAPSGHLRGVRPHTLARKLSATALVLVSTVIGLLLAEIGLRFFTRYGPGYSGLPAVNAAAGASDVLRYVSRVPAVPGTDRRWFTENPPPLPNRSEVTPQRLERTNDFRKRGIFSAQADYIWNRNYVESERCAVNSIFQDYPDQVLAFSPAGESFHPRFRFPPNVTTAAGLVTNQFGFRGHPLSLEKPKRTIRIAFAGASTTVGFHAYSFSYPEYVEAWLNRYAAANHLDVRFEAINTGREGLNSEDIAAIIHDEALPLDPDIVVYYEGSNQFRPIEMLSSPVEKFPPAPGLAGEHTVPAWIRTHSALGNLLDLALGFGSLPEPPKPAYHLNWSAGVDQRSPNVDNPNLPLRLPRIVKDLDSIRTSLQPIGSRLLLCSFVWLARDGMRLNPAGQQYIYKQLNTGLWPFHYSDIRRLADFQNRVLERYAASRQISFLDVAAAVPQDPNLFVDAIHMTEAGDRFRAWVVFQKLVPILRAEIDSGQLPRPADRQLPPPPSLATAEMSVRCPDTPSGRLKRLDGALSLDTINLAYAGASIERSVPVKVVTASAPSSYAASIAINVPLGLARPCYLYLRGHVTRGQIGVGVFDRESKYLQVEKAFKPSSGMLDMYVPVLFPDRASALLIRNLASSGVRSTILIEDAGLVAFQKTLPEDSVKVIPLQQVQVGNPAAEIHQDKEGLQVTASPGEGAFAARVPLGIAAITRERLSVHIWLRVTEGKIGAGILTPDSKAFLREETIPPLSRTLEVILPLPVPPVTGDLIIRNMATGQVVSKALLQRVEIRKAP